MQVLMAKASAHNGHRAGQLEQTSNLSHRAQKKQLTRREAYLERQRLVGEQARKRAEQGPKAVPALPAHPTPGGRAVTPLRPAANPLQAWRADFAQGNRIISSGTDKVGLLKNAAKALMPLRASWIDENRAQNCRRASRHGRRRRHRAERSSKDHCDGGKRTEAGGQAEPLPTISAATFEGKPVPPRQWIVPGLIPDRNVTLLAGDGGTGKSLLALQLAVAVALGNVKWIGQSVTGGRALYLSAEDETDEVHRRLFDINADYNCHFADLKNLEIVPLAGQDAVLAAPAVRTEIIQATPLWQQLIQLIKTHRPKLVILDTLADLFAGNESSRPQARQFISLLRGVALKYDLAFVVLSHPSLTGLASGTGSAGSTGWGNSVRSRLYFSRIIPTFQAKGDLKPIQICAS